MLRQFSYLAAILAASSVSAQQVAPSGLSDAPAAMDIAAAIGAVSGHEVSLSIRGKTVVVVAELADVDGCSAKMTAHAPGKTSKWSRRIDWGDLAWIGRSGGNRVTAVFFEPEARLAGDTMIFDVEKPDEFRATVARLSQVCRERTAPAQTVAFGPDRGMRSCYPSRLPELQIIETPDDATLPPRASLTVLSRENPLAELHLLAERATAPGGKATGEWARPLVAFVFADGQLRDKPVTAARFALDGEGTTTEQSLAAYGDTRVRITMDPFGDRPAKGGIAPFYPRLARSLVVTMNLVGADGGSRGTFTFEAGPAMAVAQQLLEKTNWSCASAGKAMSPATAWRQ